MLYELCPAEIIVPLKFPNRTCGTFHHFSPAPLEDWLEHERLLAGKITERDGNERIELQVDTAAFFLWDKHSLRVAGYHCHGADLMDQANWRDLVPVNHRVAAVAGLSIVAAADIDAEAYDIDPSLTMILLQAARDGEVYGTLRHVFRTPSPDHKRRHSAAVNTMLHVTGARTPTTLIGSRLRAQVKLYDELIEKIDGYAVKGEPAASREAAIQYMDVPHKKIAEELLFTT